MKPSILICATCCIAASAFDANAQDQYTEYLGAIKTSPQPMCMAINSLGHLVYGTFSGPNSALILIEDPDAAVGNENDLSSTITVNNGFAAGRGYQTISVGPNDILFASGDTGNAAIANIWAFGRVGEAPYYSEITSFANNATAANAGRRSSVAVVSTEGDGLLITSGFSIGHYFNFSGNLVGSPLTGGSNYIREIVYNSTDNVLYALRNGNNSNNMIDYYWTGINPTTGGGTFVASTLIDDGASNSGTGTAAQNGFYFAEQNQLVTLDGTVNIGGERVQPQVRVWDLNENGTSVSLAYAIDGISETEKFNNLGDAVIHNDRLYIDAPSSASIFVFGLPGSRVSDWKEY